MPRGWRVYGALAAMAVLLGPVSAWVLDGAGAALEGHTLAAEAVASCVAGVALVLSCGGRRVRLSRPAGRAVWLLLLPHVVAAVLASQVLPAIPRYPVEWGVAMLLGLAAPLWLGLLSGLNAVTVEVPGGVIAASIAGMATVLMAAETSAYAVRLIELPMLAVQLALELLTVYAWVFAAERLRGVPAREAAARFLLLRAGCDALLSVVTERTSLAGARWSSAAGWLGADAAVTAVGLLLWFVLLGRLRPARFALHPLALWAASVVGGIVVFGAGRWEMDAAAAVALGALWYGLRAQPAERAATLLELG